MGSQLVKAHVVRNESKHGAVWRVRLDYGADPLTGKRMQPYDPHTYATEAEARRRAGEVQADANRGPRLDPSRRTVGEVISEWLDTEARLTVRPRTLESYESICRVHLVPAFGTLQLAKLSSGAIERWRAQKIVAGASTRVVTLSTLHLGQACAYAMRHSYINHNPVKALRALKTEHTEMQVWSGTEATSFIAATAMHIYSPIWSLALYTGMRKGELIGLKWEDVDLERRILRVRRTLGYAGGALCEEDTKSRQARSIDISEPLVRILHEHRARQNAARLQLGPSWGGTWVCATNIGTPINPSNLTRQLNAQIAATAVSRIRFHDLRHTCASLLLAAGVPVHVVSRQLGHANAAITLRVYAHLMPGQGAEAAGIMGRVLAGNG